MEMHQVRYFLAVARLLNFTRAAEDCNVSQPSLTRAVKLLEYELGGDLLRRERGLTHLTELGERMLPLLTQCYESATSAKAVAAAMKSHKAAALRFGIPHAVDVAPFVPPLVEIVEAFQGLALKIVRASADDTAEILRNGQTDIAITSAALAWDRFESWPLFREPLRLAFRDGHRFSNKEVVAPGEIAGETLVLRRHCQTCDAVTTALDRHGVEISSSLEASADPDVIELIGRGIGLAFMPASTTLPSTIRTVRVDGLDLSREIRVATVQGRQRSPVTAMLLTLLRAADWSRYDLGAMERAPLSSEVTPAGPAPIRPSA
ncbi:LysR family transcriptional regulator [Acuticoccus kandeliae]|uniref:LysR family transcriptional regulator n=1 Tax=Acuticoccus kandeliae TaxID=2073160 RepID=UPI0014748B1D|nr:LysR family transcriptional regulator [Acuticoccus kandeliae]